MPDDDLQELDDASGVAIDEGSDDDADGEPQSLDLIVNIDSPSACERHVTVTLSRADIDRYFDASYSEMMPTANVPGFRIGRAPRKIVESRFKKEVGEQVKGSLLMDCLEQISEEKQFAAISEPELDLEAVEVPDTGPMTFEFDIEVRPEFDMPKWKGLKVTRPVRDFTDKDIDEQLEQMLTRYAQLVPIKEAATSGDYLTVNITCTADGVKVEEDEERVLRIRPVLSFTDGEIQGFDKLMDGVNSGDRRTTDVKLTAGAPNENLAGQTVSVEFEVLEVKKLKLPELDDEFLAELGDFDSEDALRDAIGQNLQRQLDYEQQQKAREQITKLLVESADWELPPGLLKRQGARELERAVMEMRRSGFSEAEIRARENQLRQNSNASTATALKEHFILERIAEDESIDVDEADYEKEIFLMAMQSGESPRRVRAQLDKRGLMDVLRNQIVERKVLELVQSEAKFNDEPYQSEQNETEAIQLAAGGGGTDAIPEAFDANAGEDDTEQ
ncbi:MAG: trigger factor [Aeoliella sp.]